MMRGENACIKNFIEQGEGEDDEQDYSPIDFII